MHDKSVPSGLAICLMIALLATQMPVALYSDPPNTLEWEAIHRTALSALGNCAGCHVDSSRCKHSQAWRGQTGGNTQQSNTELTSNAMIILMECDCKLTQKETHAGGCQPSQDCSGILPGCPRLDGDCLPRELSTVWKHGLASHLP